MQERLLGILKDWFAAQGGHGGPFVNIGITHAELDGGFDLNDLAGRIAREAGKE